MADAEADARWALEHGAGIYRMRALGELIRVMIERDELQEAEDVADRVVDPGRSGSLEVPPFLLARAQLRGAQGRLEEALEDLLECGRRCERLRQFGRAAVWRAEAAVVHAALGNDNEAIRLAGEQLELARTFGRPRQLGISLRACGLVDGGDAGLGLLADAVNTLERSQSPLELAARCLTMARRCGALAAACGPERSSSGRSISPTIAVRSGSPPGRARN